MPQLMLTLTVERTAQGVNATLQSATLRHEELGYALGRAMLKLHDEILECSSLFEGEALALFKAGLDVGTARELLLSSKSQIREVAKPT